MPNEKESSSLPTEGTDQSQSQATKRKGPKPSSKRRMENFRLKKSNETTAQIHADMRARLMVPLDELCETLSQLKLQQSQQVASVPITTRAVGFLSNECFERAVHQQPRAAEVCDVNQLYRVSLAQVSAQLQQSEVNVKGLTDPISHPKQDIYLADDMKQQIHSQPQNFALVANLVNSIGNFDYQAQKFTPFIAVPAHFEINEDAPTDTPKRRATTSKRNLPDPYTVTLNNLRDTVESLSDPEIPFVVRNRFRNLNPLPHARWSAESILLNPNDIIPPGYNRVNLRSDCMSVKNFLGILGSKMSSLIGDCNFDGNGSVSQLCSAYQSTLALSDVMNPDPHCRFRCSRPLEDQEMVLGMLHLLGEYPIEPPDPRVYSLRDPSIAVGYQDVDWLGLVDRCLIVKR